MAKAIGRSVNDCEFGGPQKPLDTHATARQIKTYLHPNFDSYLSFAFVRNPWDRLYSWYTFLCQGTSVRFELKDRTTKMGFKRWLMDHEHVMVRTFERKEKTIGGQKRSQLDWITDEDGNRIVDYVGKFETLHEDYEFVREFHKLKAGPLPKAQMRKSNHGKYQEAYDDEMREFVETYFARDIETFGYTF